MTDIEKLKKLFDEFVLNDVDGECEYVGVIKTAVIRILKPEFYGDRILKYCAEKILIHELLHCKLWMIDEDSAIYDVVHQVMNDMAISLMTACYGVDRKYFEDFKY